MAGLPAAVVCLFLSSGVIATNCPEKICRSPEDTETGTILNLPWKLTNFPDYRLSDDTLQKLMNKQINLELQAYYVYLSMAFHFSRDDQAYFGFFKLFRAAAEEEQTHAYRLMDFLNKRGTRIHFQSLPIPCDSDLLAAENDVPKFQSPSSRDCTTIQSNKNRKAAEWDSSQVVCEWGDPLSAVGMARQLEINVWRHLQLVHLHAEKKRDFNLQDLIEDYLKEQVDSIKELSDLLTRLKRVEPCVGFHIIDKELEEKYDKK